jgi:RNA polymerase sigma factor (sigma-70 family)
LSTAPTDIQLWNHFKNGDRESFAELFRRYYPLLFQYGSKLCTDSNLLEDCIQELFVDLWLSPSQVQVQSVRAYLLKALKYKIFKTYRNKDHRSTTEITDDMAFEISHESFLICSEDDHQKARRIVYAIQQLPARQKEIIYLKLYQGLNYEELSEIMRINYQASRNLFYQAVKSLRKMLSGDES